MVVYRDYDPAYRRVARFYAAHNPVKLEEVGFVEKVVQMYASEGEEVFSRLVTEYGPEPEPEPESGSDEEIEYAVASDAVGKNVDPGDHVKLLERLEAFYGLYNPAKLKEAGFINKILQAYAGKEDTLFARLVDQYGPEPAMQAGIGVEASMPNRHETGGETGVVQRDDSESVSMKGRGIESSVSLRT